MTFLKLNTIIIYVLSLVIPLSIIHWGIGQEMLFHPDEIYFNIANVIDLIAHSESLEFFNYPHYLFNLTFVVFHILEFFGLEIDTFGIAYIGRSLVALHYAGCVVVIFKILELLKIHRFIIYLTTFLSAFLPAFIMHSVFITDLPMTFYILLIGYFCIRAQLNQNIRYLSYAAICLGFATACKFTAALACVMIIYSLYQLTIPLQLSRQLSWRNYLKKLILYALYALITFSLLSPLTILHIQDLIAGLLYELNHVKEGHLGQETLAHSIRYWPIIYPFTALLPFGLGPLLFFGVFGLLYLLKNPNTRSISIFSIIWFVALGALTFQPLRYQFPVIVFSVIGFAFLVDVFINKTKQSSNTRRLLYIFLSIGVLGQLYYSLTFIDRYRNDTRIIARQWLESNLPQTSDIMFFSDQAYNPVQTYAPVKSQYFKQARWYNHRKRAHMMIGDKHADYLVLSSINYLRDYRDKTSHLHFIHQTRTHHSNWRLIKRFSDRHLPKRALFFLDPFFSSYFLSPDIEIYKRLPSIRQLPATIDFSQHGDSDLVTSKNWYRSHKSTRWMKQEGGEITLRLAPELENQDLLMTLKLRAFSNRDSIEVEVKLEDNHLDTIELNNQQKGESQPQIHEVVLPKKLIQGKEHLIMTFNANKFTRPSDIAPNLNDKRLLSIGFDQIDINPTDSAQKQR